MPSRATFLNAACITIGKAGKIFGTGISRPTFIIGTGRCGTTLLVDILNSHRRLSGFPDEANELWHPALEPFEHTSLDIPPIEVDPRRFTRVSLANWPRNHAATLRDIFVGFHTVTGASKRFFTKSAMISFMLPKIIEIFPDAKILHIYRFGPSVVESYFKKNFGKYSRHVFGEEEYRRYCALYWNSCILEIEERAIELSLDANAQFMEFSYESLCDTPRAILDRIAAFLGIDPMGFTFDISRIASENRKAPDYALDPARAGLLDIMHPGMALKGYLP